MRTKINQTKEANKEFMFRRSKNLLEDHKVLQILDEWKVKKAAKKFHLGLSDLYTDRNKNVHDKALVAPVIDKRGKPLSKSVYFNLPGITVNPDDENCWFRGSPLTYYSAAYSNQVSVFVCSDIKDLWFLSQLITGTPLEQEVIFIASTSENPFPAEWYEKEYWQKFENIYLAFPKTLDGNESATAISKIAGNITKRVFPAGGNDANWKSFCRSEKTDYKIFQSLLDKAKSIDPIFDLRQNEIAPGRYGYDPVDITGAFHNNYLYYPIKTLTNVTENYCDEHGKTVSQISTKIEIVLVRSDRTIQTVNQMPAPRGTPLNERVLRLSDGTLIESHPKSSAYSTWSWESAQAFCSNKSKTRPLNAILSDISDFLKKNVWLPFRHDYDLLTLLVPVTFAQSVFQSVPLVLVTGPPGSGKSALGKAMVQICANAATVGQISAAATARLIDETKGFVVFDDLESIGKRKGREAAGFSELVQSLKLSYNKETAWKSWTDMSSGGKVKRLNFYGVKMINNTTGADHILGSRLLKIYTQKIPKVLQQNFGTSEEWNPFVLQKLRDELHTWTFENVSLIDETYCQLFSFMSDRNEEMTASLKVFAEIAGDGELKAGLKRALEFQSSIPDGSADPVELLKEAVKRLVLYGYTKLSPTHISLEMRHLVSERPSFLYENNAKWESLVGIGRQLRSLGLVEINAPDERKFLHGKYLRIYPLDKTYLKVVLKDIYDVSQIKTRKALGFCAVCNECKYQNVACSIRESRFTNKLKRTKSRV